MKVVTMDVIISGMNANTKEDAIQTRDPVQRCLEDIVG